MMAYSQNDRSALEELESRVLTQPPEPSDAIVWLQGNRYDRGPKVLTLWEQRYAPMIVVSGNDVRHDVAYEHDGVHVTTGDLRRWLLNRGVPASAMVVDDRAMHTRGQAEHVLAIAQERHWSTLLLIASSHHQLRAFLTFVQRAVEVEWGGHIINQPATLAWDAVPAGRTETVQELRDMEFDKIIAYGAHCVSRDVAQRYLVHP